MAKAPNPKDAPASLDDLLAGDAASTDAPASADAAVSGNDDDDTPDFDAILATPAPQTPAQKRLAEARAKKAEMDRLAAEAARHADEEDAYEEDEYAGLSEEEIAELKAIEDATAKATAKLVENARETFVPSKGEVTVVHVVEDGFTEFGRVWMRGQELHIDEAAYKRTQDRNGNSWVDELLNDPHEQFRRWGHVYVAPGPFKPRPGEVFDDALSKEDKRRQGKIPAMTRD